MSVQNVAKAINLFGKHGISEGNTNVSNKWVLFTGVFQFLVLSLSGKCFGQSRVNAFCLQVCHGRCSFQRCTPFTILHPATPKKPWRRWRHGGEKSRSQFPQLSPAALHRSAPSVVRSNHKIKICTALPVFLFAQSVFLFVCFPPPSIHVKNLCAVDFVSQVICGAHCAIVNSCTFCRPVVQFNIKTLSSQGKKEYSLNMILKISFS